MFPKAIFEIKSARPVKDPILSAPNFEVLGLLELRGIQNEIGFLATAILQKGGEVKIEADFDIDRTRWNVIYGSSRFFEHLGMHLVFDLISIQLTIVAR